MEARYIDAAKLTSAKWLVQAIESLLAQAYRPVGVIVVDDGSTDGSAEGSKQFLIDVTASPDCRIEDPNEACGYYESMRDAGRIKVIAAVIQSRKAENKITGDVCPNEVVTKLSTAVKEASDEFEISTLIRRRSLGKKTDHQICRFIQPDQ
jgi:cellulose synthase/poly-beta-1,6-N-acetylglucosamine synthase-like glycosyltransferase